MFSEAPSYYNEQMKTAKTLLKNLPIDENDSARLLLEALETHGLTDLPQDRESMLRLLRKIIREGVDTVRRSTATVTFATAADLSLQARASRRSVTRRDLRYYIHRLLRIEGLGTRPLRAITTSECREVLARAFGHSVHSYRKARAILHSIFAFGLRHDWCSENPVSPIDIPAVTEKRIHPLCLEEVRRLERVAARREYADMRFSLNLLLYCGVRPAEITRINPATDIDWEHNQLLIRPQTSKTGGGRIIPLRKAARLPRELCIIPKRWTLRWRALRRSAGFEQWQPDICRHTFATYHAQHFRDLKELQLEMGHSSLSLLRTRYMMATLGNACTTFWK